MIRMSGLGWLKVSAVVFSVGVFFQLPSAQAAIVKIQPTQACNVIGLDTSTATAQGGVHCNTGNTAFSLSQVLNGTIKLLVGNSATPSWDLINDTGAALTSLTLYFGGQVGDTLASNSSIDLQQTGGIFTACSTTTGNNLTNSDSNCGTGDITPDGPVLPVKMVWSAGTGVAIGGTFNLGTASFAHAGQDQGCISGSSTCSPSTTPEPSALIMLGSGLLGFVLLKRRTDS